MIVIGILYTPTQLHADVLQTQLSIQYPTQTPRPFHLDYRQFVWTESLAPKSEVKRTSAHVFTSSHTPRTGFVGAANSFGSYAGSKLEMISMPTFSAEKFITLTSQQLQRQWASRQVLSVDNGTTMTLMIPDDARWTMSIGNLRASSTKLAGTTSSQHRGVLLEIQYETTTDESESDSLLSDEERTKYETLFQSLLKAVLGHPKLDFRFDETKMSLLKMTTTTMTGQNESTRQNGNENTDATSISGEYTKPRSFVGSDLAELYMDLLHEHKT